jgi:hypothetical protein
LPALLFQGNLFGLRMRFPNVETPRGASLHWGGNSSSRQTTGRAAPSRARRGARVVSASDDCTVRLWDAATGEAVAWRAEMLPEGEYAVLRADGSGAIAVSPGAWRWLGWLAKDPATGALTRYPAEIFGPLPEASRISNRGGRS